MAFDRAIGAEDKAMLEQVPGPMPLGQTDLVSVQSDKPSVEWRRRLSQTALRNDRRARRSRMRNMMGAACRRDLFATSLIVLLAAACNGGGSDIGPRLARIPDSSAKVQLLDDQNRGGHPLRISSARCRGWALQAELTLDGHWYGAV